MDSAADTRGGEKRIPRLAPDWDPTQVSLTPAEGFLLSRIDGQTPWEVLLHIGGLPPDEIDRCLQRWLGEGVLSVTGSAAEPHVAAPSRPSGDDDDPVDEGLGLPVKTQQRILEFERALGDDYFEVLGVDRRADGKAIKRAYFQLSREFHPDRYYRRDLGPFQPRLESIFRKLVEAYELLSDPATRAEIERSLPPASARPEKRAEGEADQAEPKRHDKWSRLERLRKKFQIPEEVLAERRFKAKQFYDAAMISARKERWLEAAASVRLAIAFDPGNKDFKVGFADVQSHVHRMRAEELLEKANASWDDSSRQEALKLYEEALHYRPSDPVLNDRVAQLYLDARNHDRALEFAETACEVAPEVGDYHRTLGRVYRAQGLRDKAAAALEEAIRLNPEDALAEEQLTALRRRRGGMRRGGKR